MSNQPMQEEETFIRNPLASPQLPTQDSSGYFSTSTPSSRRGSFSSISGFVGKEEHRQEENELESKVKELEKENEYLKKKNIELEKLSQEIAEESDRREGELIEENQALQKKIMGLETKLERMIKELDSKNQDIELLKQQISALEQDQRDRDAKIAELKKQLVDEKSKVLSADKTNEELCKKLGKSEAELNKLRAENTTLKSDLEKIVKGIEGGKEEQLAEQLMKTKKETETLADEVNRLAEELNQLQKEKENLEKVIRQSNVGGEFLADETLEQLQDILRQEEGQREIAAVSTQTEVRHESKGIQASIQQHHVETEPTAPETQDQNTQETQPKRGVLNKLCQTEK